MEELFRALLRASLHNPRWSWGAVRDLDQAVFLRVWEDEKIRHDDKWYMRLTAHAHFATDLNNKGWQERLRHVALVQKWRRHLHGHVRRGRPWGYALRDQGFQQARGIPRWSHAVPRWRLVARDGRASASS